MRAMPILILDAHDPERELEFEIEHMLSLTSAERYQWMFARSREAVERMIRNGYLQTPQVVKRPARAIRSHRRKRVSKSRIHAPHQRR